MIYNRPGQHHALVYARPTAQQVNLRYADFSPTGFVLTPDMLVYEDGQHRGLLRLDYHERLATPKGHIAFHLGGAGYVNAQNIKYGHIWLGEVAPVTASPIPSGDHRGSAAPVSLARYRIKVKSIPYDMLYKPTGGQALWSHYGDPGADQGDRHDIHYSYLLWSFLNVGGGGMVRALLKPEQQIRRCLVPSIKMPSWDPYGRVNGEVVGVYVRVRPAGNNVYGWTVWSHQKFGQPVVYHAEKY